MAVEVVSDPAMILKHVSGVVDKMRQIQNLQQVRLSPEFGSAEALAGFGIASLEEVVEEVTTISLLAKLGALSELTLAVLHVAGTATSQSREEEFVNLELVDDGHSTALLRVSIISETNF